MKTYGNGQQPETETNLGEAERALSAALASLPEIAAQSGERSPDFWRSQRLAIAAQMAGAAPCEPRWVPWSVAVAAVILAAVLLSRPVAPPQSQALTSRDPDHELLVGIEQSLRRSVPLALEPATLLTQELHSATVKPAP